MSFWSARGPIIALGVGEMQAGLLWWRAPVLIVGVKRYVLTASPEPGSMIGVCVE